MVIPLKNGIIKNNVRKGSLIIDSSSVSQFTWYKIKDCTNFGKVITLKSFNTLETYFDYRVLC